MPKLNIINGRKTEEEKKKQWRGLIKIETKGFASRRNHYYKHKDEVLKRIKAYKNR